MSHTGKNHAVVGILVAAWNLAGASALAGGGPENAMLVIDPTNPISMYVGNYYKNARNIPDSNVLYVRSAATNYASFVNTNQAAFIGSITQRGLTNHADYVVLAPLDTFFVPAPGLVSDGCSPVTRFSLSSVYAMAQISGTITPGGVSSQLTNQYYAAGDSAIGFDSEQGYLSGSPSSSGSARRYFIGGMLGYTNSIVANSVPEILNMIDRSVIADGTRPAGNFYFMNNLTDPCRNVRACTITNCTIQSCTTPTIYNAARSAIMARMGAAQVLSGLLPPSDTADCLGIMTGDDDLNIPAANLTFVPGMFGDHLTSYGAAFDVIGQTKVAQWIAYGASGSEGTVEEPCNYNGKFCHARFHVYYYQGMSLGESYLRSVQYVPFQGLLYGDPLTRPFAYIPVVNVTNPPVGPMTGTITITPTATTAAPSAAIAGYDLLVDGVQIASVNFGQSFTLDTATLSDGRHDLRVLARDNTLVKSVGRWIGTLDTANYGHTASVGVTPSSGNLAQAFAFNYSASASGLREVRLMQNGRVLAASTAATGTLTVYGQNLGAGTSTVKLEAEYTDNRRAVSVPVSVDVSSSGTPAGSAPVAFSYSKNLLTNTAHLVELPASTDADPATATYTMLSEPKFSTQVQTGLTGPYRIYRPIAGATGSEPVQFRVTTAAGQSNIATVTLMYTLPEVCRADWNNSGTLNSQDFFDFIASFFANAADYNNSGATDSQDFFDFLADFFTGCP